MIAVRLSLTYTTNSTSHITPTNPPSIGLYDGSSFSSSVPCPVFQVCYLTYALSYITVYMNFSILRSRNSNSLYAFFSFNQRPNSDSDTRSYKNHKTQILNIYIQRKPQKKNTTYYWATG